MLISIFTIHEKKRKTKLFRGENHLPLSGPKKRASSLAARCRRRSASAAACKRAGFRFSRSSASRLPAPLSARACTPKKGRAEKATRAATSPEMGMGRAAAVVEEVEREEREEGLEVATIDDHGDGRIDECEEVDVAGAFVRMVHFKIAMVMLLLLRTRERK